MSLESQSATSQETEDPLHQETTMRKVGAVGLNGAGHLGMDLDTAGELEETSEFEEKDHPFAKHPGIDEEHPHIVPGQE